MEGREDKVLCEEGSVEGFERVPKKKRKENKEISFPPSVSHLPSYPSFLPSLMSSCHSFPLTVSVLFIYLLVTHPIPSSFSISSTPHQFSHLYPPISPLPSTHPLLTLQSICPISLLLPNLHLSSTHPPPVHPVVTQVWSSTHQFSRVTHLLSHLPIPYITTHHFYSPSFLLHQAFLLYTH